MLNTQNQRKSEVESDLKNKNMEKVKKFWSNFGQGVSVAFAVATLVAEQDNLLTGLFFAIFTGASLFVGSKIYESFKK